jgi:dTDP-glucose 4,6-dehydratase/UDP-glucuronate decarboxylase
LPDRLIRFEARDLAKPFEVKDRYDYIFHAACYGQPAKFVEDPFRTAYLNTEATRALLQIARRSGGTFLFFSSAEIYGGVPKGMNSIPESFSGMYPTLSVRSIYGESKRLGESICFFFYKQYGVKTKIVRISHLYGPGTSIHDRRVLSDFIRKALQDGRIHLLDQGKAVKTYGYVADAIQMILHVALHSRDMVYNVGGRDSVSIRELASLVGKYCAVPVIVPRRVSTLPHVGGDPQFIRLNLAKIRDEMKKFRFTPFREGLRRTIEWSKLVLR